MKQNRQVKKRIKRIAQANKREALYHEATKRLLRIVAVFVKGMSDEKITVAEDFESNILQVLDEGNVPILDLLREVGGIPLGDGLEDMVAMA